MADVLRIKRRALGGAVGAPGSLAVGELAFNEQDGGLYIGRSNGSVVQINSAASSLTISDTPPASPSPGQLWWESDSGKLYLYYNDGNTSQWVSASGSFGAPLGVTDGSNAPAGYVGEYQQYVTTSGPTLAASTVTNCGSLALTAGDWDVWMNCQIIPPSASSIELELSSAGTLSGVFPNYQGVPLMSGGGNNVASIGPLRFNSSSAITVSLMARAGIASQQITRIFIGARRRR